MASRRILALRPLFGLGIVLFSLPLLRWQWFDAYELTVKACRQRLAILTNQSWMRADFYDRYGRPLTNRERIYRPWIPRQDSIAMLHGGTDPLAVANLPTGAFTLPVPVRYSSRPLAVHLLGYLNPGDGRGAAGLEGAYDEILTRGEREVVAAIVDARGRWIPGLGLRFLRVPERQVQAVQLTVDGGLQARVEEIADRYLPKGAIVVMEPHTGEILAMVSRPGFDPQHPETALAAPDSPFLNRALTAYPPGSLFKLVVLAAALEDRPEMLWQIFHDTGSLAIGSLSFSCAGRPHGDLSLADALAFSCNTVFIQIGLALGARRICAMAERLGLGSPALQDLPGEDPGELPAAGGRSLGDVANMAIGQRDVFVTPVQVARLVSAVANGGYDVPTHVISRLHGQAATDRPVRSTAENGAVRVLTPWTARTMRAMMGGVVRYGTGRAACLPAGAGGKTGTAQTGQRDAMGRPLNHAWFAGFAPLDQPRFVAVVFVEEGDSGGGVAAPIFRRVIQAALSERS